MPKKTPDVFEGGPPSLKVAMCQVYTEPWAVEENVRRTLEALDEAASQGAELAITPECVFHGYGFGGVDDFRGKMREVAEPLHGPNLSAVRAKAKAHGLDVVVGFAELGDNGCIHNSAALISREGELLSVYRKVHCRPFECIHQQGVFVPGERFEVHALRYGDRAFNVGTMICFDREVPESVRCLRGLGAEIIACPLACDTCDMSQANNWVDNEVVTRVRAAENEVFIVVVNHSGRFNGGSFAVGPGGELLHQMGPGPGVVTLDLPVGAIPRMFHRDPLGWMGWGYRRPEVYRPYLDR